ncbi:MAG: CHAT domain-containing tetratricopeptide repeat protein [Candidatus Obscuribacterales bacterium]|nr:CHAT domain-containing tetratricopeptide repeat protein [Candidatus Obscuribacterales bacterium]
MKTISTDPDETRVLIEALADRAWHSLQDGNFDDAAVQYQDAVQLARDIKDCRAESVCMTYLGMTRQYQKNWSQAALDLACAAEMAAANSLHSIETQARLLLAEQNRDSGNLDIAIEQFEKGARSAVASGDEEAIELACGNLGNLYLERGWLEQALEWLTKALAVSSGNESAIAWLGSMGLACAELGLWKEAESNFQQASKKAEEIFDLASQINCLGSLGNLCAEQDRLQESIAYYQRALNLSQNSADKHKEGIWLGNVGIAYLKLGEVDKAEDYCRKAIASATSFNDKFAQAANLDSLGDCLMKNGSVEAAKEAYEEALTISNELGDRQGTRIYLSNIGRVYRTLGQLQPAFEHFGRAIALFDEQRASIKGDEIKTTFANRGQALYSDMVQICISMNKRVEALEFVGQAKSRALLDLLSNSPIDISELAGVNADDALKALIAREIELRRQITTLEKRLSTSDLDTTDDANSNDEQNQPPQTDSHRGMNVAQKSADSIYKEWHAVVDSLKKRHPNYASLISTSSSTVNELRGAIDTNTAIIELFWTDNYLLSALFCKDSNEPVIEFIQDKEALDKLSQDLQSFIEMCSAEGFDVPLSLSRRLYKTLIEPLLADLPAGINKLIIAPHNSLFHLPFAALHNGQKYLCERFALCYLPTTSLIPVMTKIGDNDPQESRCLVSAVSDYSATRSGGFSLNSRLRSAAGLDDLAYTLEEAENIFAISENKFPNSKLVKNEEVTESLHELFKSYPIVHFAGHAIFNSEEPLASGLVLGDGSVLTAASILKTGTLRTNCGQLLVLSACQTGVNAVTAGGEILGLTRALMYAGMPNLVLSLWEVADKSTSAFMQHFHQELSASSTAKNIDGSHKLNVAHSLQSAQIKAIAEGQSAHAWAPFIHMGID